MIEYSRYLVKRTRTLDIVALAWSMQAKNVTVSGMHIWAQFPTEEIAREYFQTVRRNGYKSAGAFRGNYSHTWDVRVK